MAQDAAVRQDADRIETLRNQLVRASSSRERALTAAMILKRLPNDPNAERVIEEAAREAVRFGSPDPLLYDAYDANGKARLSPDFERWCREHSVDPGATLRLITSDYALQIQLLSMLPKGRSLPLLKEGLRSQISFVAVSSAACLAMVSPTTATLHQIIDSLELRQSSVNVESYLIAFLTIPESATDQRTQLFLKNRGLAKRLEEIRRPRPSSK